MNAEQNTQQQTLATVANMLKAAQHGKRCFAFSPNTMEVASATPGDYFHMPDDEPLVDSEGEPMVLAVKVTRYIDAITGFDYIAS